MFNGELKAGKAFAEPKNYSAGTDQKLFDEFEKLLYLLQRISQKEFFSPECTIHLIHNPYAERFEGIISDLIRKEVGKVIGEKVAVAISSKGES